MGMEKRRRKQLLLSVSFLCLAVLLSGALLAPPASAASPAGMKRRRAGFDYYMLALQWPGTVCRQTNHYCSSNGCCRSKPLEWFTIHGLWPQYSNGDWPQSCRSATLNINKISALKPQLEKYWPSLCCGSSSTCSGGSAQFWEHEWETHGTCGYPEIQDEYDYFDTTLKLYSKYDVTTALRNAQVYIGSDIKYSVRRINAVIKKAFRAKPLLVCENDSVKELRLCFKKVHQPRTHLQPRMHLQLKPRDCTLRSSSPCRGSVTFPSYKPYALSNATEGVSNQVNDEPHA